MKDLEINIKKIATKLANELSIKHTELENEVEALDNAINEPSVIVKNANYILEDIEALINALDDLVDIIDN